MAHSYVGASFVNTCSFAIESSKILYHTHTHMGV